MTESLKPSQALLDLKVRSDVESTRLVALEALASLTSGQERLTSRHVAAENLLRYLGSELTMSPLFLSAILGQLGEDCTRDIVREYYIARWRVYNFEDLAVFSAHDLECRFSTAFNEACYEIDHRPMMRERDRVYRRLLHQYQHGSAELSLLHTLCYGSSEAVEAAIEQAALSIDADLVCHAFLYQNTVAAETLPLTNIPGAVIALHYSSGIPRTVTKSLNRFYS